MAVLAVLWAVAISGDGPNTGAEEAFGRVLLDGGEGVRGGDSFRAAGIEGAGGTSGMEDEGSEGSAGLLMAATVLQTGGRQGVVNRLWRGDMVQGGESRTVCGLLFRASL